MVTLISTVISNSGIVQASDSNLTGGGGTAAGTGPKVFRLDFAPAALALAGVYSVGGDRMDTWMPQCISSYHATASPTLPGFADYLRQRLTDDMDPAEKRIGLLIQIAGYVPGPSDAHPEMLFVRNIEHIDPCTGEYSEGTTQFKLTPDFWDRDYLTDATKAAFRGGGFQRYFNGTPPGRIAFLGLNDMLWRFYRDAWQHPSWQVRAPQTLEELAGFVKLEIQAIGTMFQSSDYPAPLIGGDVQIETIPPPPNCVTL